MIIRKEKRFQEEFIALPRKIQLRVVKQLDLFLQNPRHPSLRIRKMEGQKNIWEGHVTRGYCFTFKISGNIYVFRRIGTHSIYRKP